MALGNDSVLAIQARVKTDLIEQDQEELISDELSDLFWRLAVRPLSAFNELDVQLLCCQGVVVTPDDHVVRVCAHKLLLVKGNCAEMVRV